MRENENVEADAVSWNRFRTFDLTIDPALVGESHEFIYRRDSHSYRVRIELPAEEAVRGSKAENNRLWYSAWRMVDGKEMPQYLWVRDVDALIFLPRPVKIPVQILDKPPNQYEILSQGKQKSLDRLAHQYRELAEEVLDLWIRTLRWKSGNSAIGRPPIIDSESGWGTYLREANTRQPFWRNTGMLYAKHSEPVTVSQWYSVHRSLSENRYPPTHYDLMFNAEEHIRRGNLRLAVIDLAVACEVYVRGVVDGALPMDLLGKIRDYVEMAPVHQVYMQFFPELLDKNQEYEFDRWKNQLEKLFGYRNDIMHSGGVERLTAKECNRFLEVTEFLFSLGEISIRNRGVFEEE